MIADHRAEVRQRVAAGVGAALDAMGATAAGLIVARMAAMGVRDTGALMADVDWAAGDGAVDVGNSLDYGRFVHEGTSTTAGRPYIRDALLGAGPALEEAAAGGFRGSGL